MVKKGGTLYLISTPIGNLEDITLRAIRFLKSLSVFFAEDTRELGNLLSALNIENKKNIYSCAAHNMKEATEAILKMLSEGAEVGFCTDRGTPGISDPGAYVTRRARESGFSVSAIPGVSSLAVAVSLSGVEEYPLHFWGFIEAKNRKEVFQTTQMQPGIHYFFESPKRVTSFLKEFSDFFPAQNIFVAKELTKMFERAEWALPETLLGDKAMEKGEFVLAYEILEKKPEKGAEVVLEEKIKLRLAPEKEWAKEMSRQFEVPAKEIYNRLQELKKKS